MWAGVAGGDLKISNKDSFFVCPQQPSLKLAFSRVDDGICDCCDGADEKHSGTCVDICDEVLASERAARAKLRADYDVGSKIRADSISQYDTWMGEMKDKLHQLKDVDLAKLEEKKYELGKQMREEKIDFSNKWAAIIMSYIPSLEAYTSMVGTSKIGNSEHMNVDDLSSFIISLCWLSGEASGDNIVNDRCVPFDRSSIDVGIIWDHADNVDDDSLPMFHYHDMEDEKSILEYAEKIIAVAKGTDTDEWVGKNKKKSNTKRKRDYDDYDDDDMPPDDMADDDIDDVNDAEIPSDSENDEIQDDKGPSVDEMVQSRLKKLHLYSIRDLFKEQAHVLLKLTPPADEKSEIEDEEGVSSEEDESADSEEEEADPGYDPAAMNMAKSTINRRLTGIHRGEASAKFAARHIISLMKNRQTNNRSILNDMQMLALRMIQHSKISSVDIAEAFYTTSSTFRSNLEEVDPSTCPATSPWSRMCPPRMFPITGSGLYFPQDHFTTGALRLCKERADAMAGVCTAQQGLEFNDFPTTIDDGYYNYYVPKTRENSDTINQALSQLTSHFKMPTKLSKLISETDQTEKEINAIKKEIDKVERETGGNEDKETKFGFDGELFILRDTCHSIESGKYEYEVCIFGKATQRDIGQKNGGTSLGKWETMQMDDDGARTLKWTGGTQCWNGPKRSAEVIVTCGSETKLLSADEPETCRYVFTMESPIGCDTSFAMNNQLIEMK